MAYRRQAERDFVGARNKAVEPRWIALLDAALDQPAPSPELLAAIEGLRKRSPWDGDLGQQLIEQARERAHAEFKRKLSSGFPG